MKVLGHQVTSPLDIITLTRFWWDNRRSANGTIRQLEMRGITPKTLVDFGAHDSEWAKYLAARWPAMQVHSFEPHPDCNPIGTLHQIALGTENAPLRLEGGKSIESYASVTGALDVRMVRFEDYASLIFMTSPSVLKIDCENMTHLALAGCGDRLADFCAVHCEMMNDQDAQYENHQMEIHRTLWEAGFRVCKVVDCAVWPRNISYYDAVFFKD